MHTRRHVLGGLSAAMGATLLPLRSTASASPDTLAMPPLFDTTGTGKFRLEATPGRVDFLGGSETETWGFNQPYLGPTLRLPNKGTVAAEVANGLGEPFSLHWHGLLVPGDVDGGPHQPIAAGTSWAPELPLDQPTATVWYHAHTHGATARQVHKGLAGVLQLADGLDDQRGLPSTYGVDDLTLVLQDRRFDRRGRMVYDPAMHDLMMGHLGDTMVVNGQLGKTAAVPGGVVRLRLLNGSNARFYTLGFSDGRAMHLAATDGGLLDHPEVLEELLLAPGERAEILVDFSDGNDVSLMSGQHVNTPMMGGGMMGGRQPSGPPFEVLPFAVDPGLPVRIRAFPDDLGGSRPDLPAQDAAPRDFALEMSMGPRMMMRRTGESFSINGHAFDMSRLNFSVQQGVLEQWRVSANMLMHPFHVHGVLFQVLAENGHPPHPRNRGWKDTVLVDGEVDLLMRFDQPASAELPYMFHCHILEHEDGGMMGQFAVI